MKKKLVKIKEWENDYAKVIILGDAETKGRLYAEGHVVYKDVKKK